MNTAGARTVRRLVGAVAVIAALGGSVAVGVSNMSAAGEDRQQAQSVEATNTDLQERVSRGQEAAGRLDALTGELNSLRSQIPQDIDQEGFLQELSQTGQSNGITIGGLTLADPVDFSTVSGQMTDALGQVDDIDRERADAAVQAINDAVAGGLRAVPVTVTATGAYNSITGFISGVQHANRVFWVNSVNIQQDSDRSSNYKVTLGGFIFTAPDTASGAGEAAK